MIYNMYMYMYMYMYIPLPSPWYFWRATEQHAPIVASLKLINYIIGERGRTKKFKIINIYSPTENEYEKTEKETS